MAQVAHAYPAHAFGGGNPGDLEYTPVLTNGEFVQDHFPRSISPPPRHPGRLLRLEKTMTERVLPITAPRSPPKHVTHVHAVECESEGDEVTSLRQGRPPTPHRRQQPPQRQRGSNSSLGNARFSAFPIPPHELPQHPPPNRPLPQLPPTPTRSTRSRQSSGASKRSNPLEPYNAAVRCASPPMTGHNMFPPTPPQEAALDSPARATFSASLAHNRTSSSHSSSSSNRTSSLAAFPSYSTSNLPYRHPSLQSHEYVHMAPLQERTCEEPDFPVTRLASISTRVSHHSDEKHSSSNGRRTSTSTASSESGPKNKKGKLTGSGLKGLFSSKTPPLIDAVKSNDMKQLLDLMAPGLKPLDINQTERDNRTALHWAAELGYADIADILLTRNALTEVRTKSQGRTPLYHAAAHGHASLCTLLLEHGAAPNAASKMDGATALHKAAQYGFTEVIMTLVAGKADVNKKDVEGMPALMWATQRKQLHAAHKLVAAGADLETRIKRGANLENSSLEGETVLHKVSRTSDVAFARLFLEHGADANADAPAGFLALHRAAQKGEVGMCEVLLEFGAEIEKRTDEGWTPLHFAARHGNRKCCLFLLRQGANAKAQTRKTGMVGQKGETPAELARKYGFEDMIP